MTFDECKQIAKNKLCANSEIATFWLLGYGSLPRYCVIFEKISSIFVYRIIGYYYNHLSGYFEKTFNKKLCTLKDNILLRKSSKWIDYKSNYFDNYDLYSYRDHNSQICYTANEELLYKSTIENISEIKPFDFL